MPGMEAQSTPGAMPGMGMGGRRLWRRRRARCRPRAPRTGAAPRGWQRRRRRLRIDVWGRCPSLRGLRRAIRPASPHPALGKNGRRIAR